MMQILDLCDAFLSTYRKGIIRKIKHNVTNTNRTFHTRSDVRTDNIYL